MEKRKKMVIIIIVIAKSIMHKLIVKNYNK